MKFVLALCALFFAVPASASTLKIDVTTSNAQMVASCAVLDACQPLTITDFGAVSGNVGDRSLYSELFSGSGSMHATLGSEGQLLAFTECSGLFSLYCLGETQVSNLAASLFQSSDVYFFSSVTPGSFFHFDDAIASSITYFGQTFSGLYFGFTFTADVDNLSISAVPLPASFLFLLGSFGLLAMFRRTA